MAIIYTRNKSRKKKQNTAKRKEQKKDWDRMIVRIGGPVAGKRADFKPLTRPLYKGVFDQHRDRLTTGIPSRNTLTVQKPTTRRRYTGEMAEREAEAQKKIEKRKNQVAPAYNKGGLQLITNPEDFKTMGRKT